MNDPVGSDIATLLQALRIGTDAGTAPRTRPHKFSMGSKGSEPGGRSTILSDTAGVSAFTKQIEDARAQWERERNAPPVPCQLVPKSILLSQVEESRIQSMTSNTNEVKMLQTTIGHDADFSVSVLGNLSPSMSLMRTVPRVFSLSTYLVLAVVLRKMRARQVHKVRKCSSFSGPPDLTDFVGSPPPLPGHLEASYSA